MSTPPRTPPHAAGPVFDPLRELVEFVSGEGRSAPSTEQRGPVAQQKGREAQDRFTSEVIAALKEVVAVLDGPEMTTFFARAHGQGNAYTGPQINMDRLRSLLANAQERGFIPKRAA